jgi:two-component system chemotaxis response regulator CheB
MSPLVVIGASWGGLEAVGRLLEGLPPEPGFAIAVVQHRRADSLEGLVRALQARTALPVSEAEDKEPIEPGHVYLAPPDYHLLVEPGSFALSTEGRVRFSRPSIDVLFESAADAYGSDAVGVILTGAGDDGAAGLASIKERGGTAIVQDPATAERAELPAAALAAVEADAVLPLEEIAAFLAGTRVQT